MGAGTLVKQLKFWFYQSLAREGEVRKLWKFPDLARSFILNLHDQSYIRIYHVTLNNMEESLVCNLSPLFRLWHWEQYVLASFSFSIKSNFNWYGFFRSIFALPLNMHPNEKPAGLISTATDGSASPCLNWAWQNSVHIIIRIPFTTLVLRCL